MIQASTRCFVLLLVLAGSWNGLPGVSPPPHRALLPPLLGRFSQQYPALATTLMDSTAEQMISRILSQEADLGFGSDIGLYSPYFYDGVMLIAAAMKAANSTDPKKYLPALAKINYKGVTADIAFDPRGDLTHGLMTIFVVKNGKWEVVKG